MAPSTRLALTLPFTLPLALQQAMLRAAGKATLIVLLPGGGQRMARRNAWSGMSADAARRRMQREAEIAIDAAHARAHARARAGLTSGTPLHVAPTG